MVSQLNRFQEDRLPLTLSSPWRGRQMSCHSSAPLGRGTGPHSNHLLLECQRERTHNMNKYMFTYTIM